MNFFLCLYKNSRLPLFVISLHMGLAMLCGRRDVYIYMFITFYICSIANIEKT